MYDAPSVFAAPLGTIDGRMMSGRMATGQVLLLTRVFSGSSSGLMTPIGEVACDAVGAAGFSSLVTPQLATLAEATAEASTLVVGVLLSLNKCG
jgi:hypothetical protein